jgi:hypothetical protein
MNNKISFSIYIFLLFMIMYGFCSTFLFEQFIQISSRDAQIAIKNFICLVCCNISTYILCSFFGIILAILFSMIVIKLFNKRFRILKLFFFFQLGLFFYGLGGIIGIIVCLFIGGLDELNLRYCCWFTSLYIVSGSYGCLSLFKRFKKH